MHVAALGTAEQPVVLEGSITHVSQLHLGAKLHVCIPSIVTWSSVTFSKCDELDIRHVPAWLTFCLQFKHGLAGVPMNVHLLMAGVHVQCMHVSPGGQTPFCLAFWRACQQYNCTWMQACRRLHMGQAAEHSEPGLVELQAAARPVERGPGTGRCTPPGQLQPDDI